MLRIKRKVLDNGLVLLTEKRESKKAVMLIGMKVGSVNEDEKLNGGSHFNEHMLFKSNRCRSAQKIIEDLESAGTYVNAFTSEVYTSTYTKSLPQDVTNILNIFFEAYINYNYNNEEFERERGVILTEIKMGDEDHMSYVLDRMFRPALFASHPLAKSIAGPVEAMANVTKKQLEDFKAEYYIPNNTSIVVVGNFNEHKLEKRIMETFGKLKPIGFAEANLKADLPNKHEIKLETNKEINQVYLVLGYKTEGCESEDIHKLRMLRGILSGGMSSRLFTELREKRGIGYSVGAYAETFPHIGQFCTYISGFDPSRFNEALETIRGQFNDLKKNLVSDEEFNKAKKILISRFYDRMESIDSRAMAVLEKEFYKLPYDFRRVDHFVNKAKKEDILEMARKYLTDDYVLAALVPEGFKR